MELADKILDRLAAFGHGRVSINLWEKRRLYVNMEGVIPFFYDLEDGAKIVSHKRLPKDVFLHAKELCPFLRAHKQDVIGSLSGAGYQIREGQK